MLVTLKADCTPEQCQEVEEAIRRLGFVPVRVPGPSRTAVCVTGNRGPVSPRTLAHLPGVDRCIRVTQPYKLVGREVHPDDTVIEVGGARIGGAKPVVLAGPCSVESEAQTLAVARAVREAGADLFRAGAFKPRTNPYSFQGLGREGLRTLSRVREETGLAVVSEVLDVEAVAETAEHVDVLQVGTRNMQNFSLLKRLGEVDRPVLLKRGMSATLEEWLMAAEYILAAGNPRVILCERGIRTFSQHSRNTLDLNVVPLARRLSHLPVLVDPSHGVGSRERVRPLARAALAAGAQGLLLETHTEPDRSYTDADQTIDVETLMGVLRDRDVLAALEPLEAPGSELELCAATD
ncbi:MAG: 3-deoxy-7-phosphoheptulonate synthase [Planctomycetota bacterium]